ncbi:hypothetical protein AC578_6514 [Pseudocercospora eumusae]|uniref:F-box domain-containing protein n=1 Tax=Pseudocercospora eumusae TaxID=321146 RepID=A0A139HHU4_9PEZI|nr:hypothetical protein AC578_6514 [Pseudocercospora eumusae]
MNPEQNFVADYSGTKATETLHVVELAEHILSFLDTRAIIKTTRVCKQLRATLATSSKLRTLTFLTPEPHPDAIKELHARTKNEIPWAIPAGPSGIAINPLVIDTDHHSSSYLFSPRYLLFTRQSNRPKPLRIHQRLDAASTAEKIVETPASARDMLLAYQPKDHLGLEMNLQIQDEGAFFEHKISVLARVSGKITVGGLCDVLNLLWAGIPALESLEDRLLGLMVEREDLCDKAEARGLDGGAMKWVMGRAKYQVVRSIRRTN